jgi:flagellar biosynthesis protein
MSVPNENEDILNDESGNDLNETFEYTEGSEEEEETQQPLNLQYALGLEIDQKTGLPRVTTMARGQAARKMIEKAEQAGVPIERDPGLVQRMFTPVDNRVIPSKIYQVIAEILTFIYQMNEVYERESLGQELLENLDKEDEDEESKESILVTNEENQEDLEEIYEDIPENFEDIEL